MINKGSSVALSNIAKDEILKIIKELDMGVDEKIPSEAELMNVLGVSRYTVREALAMLTQEGIIYKVQGKGTFLKNKVMHIKSGLEKLESVTETIKSFGFKPGTKYVDVVISEPTEDMVKKLNLAPNEKVVTYKRIRTADDKIASYCVDTFPLCRLNGDAPEKMKNESMFKYLEEHFNIYIQSTVSGVIPVFPTKEMQKCLKVNQDHLFLLLHQIHYDREGEPTIYSMDYFNPEIFQFIINRTR